MTCVQLHSRLLPKPVIHRLLKALSRRSSFSPCGTMTASASRGSEGASQLNSNVAAAAPSSCANMKPGVSIGRIPTKESLADRARVTAGLANDVEDVNQYAAVM